jgi:hypothetical protein
MAVFVDTNGMEEPSALFVEVTQEEAFFTPEILHTGNNTHNPSNNRRTEEREEFRGESSWEGHDRRRC